MPYAKIKSIDQQEVETLFKHLLKEAGGLDHDPNDKIDLNELGELSKALGAKVEITVTYEKFVEEKVSERQPEKKKAEPPVREEPDFDF